VKEDMERAATILAIMREINSGIIGDVEIIPESVFLEGIYISIEIGTLLPPFVDHGFDFKRHNMPPDISDSIDVVASCWSITRSTSRYSVNN
jgi:hypothetical protein